MTVRHEDIATILDGAADLCEIGWTQGAFARDDEGNEIGELEPAASVCTVAAIWKSTVAHIGRRDSARADFADRMARDAILDLVGRDWGNLSTWNDSADASQAIVVERLRQGAAIQRERAG